MTALAGFRLHVKRIMRLIISFLRLYPLKSFTTLIAMLFAGVADGFGMTMLLPLLGLAFHDNGNPVHASSSLERMARSFFDALGIEPTIVILLSLFVISIIIKVVLVLVANRHVGYMVAQVATDLRLSLLRAMLKSRWSYFVHQPAGAFANAFATEAERSARAYLFGMRLVALVLNAAVYSAVAVMISWQVTVAALTAGMFVLYVLRLLVKRAKTAGRNQTEQLRSMLSLVTDLLHSLKPLKAMSREDMLGRMLTDETMKLHAALRHQVFSVEALKALQEPLTTTLFAVGLYVALAWYSLSMSGVLVMVYILNKIIKCLQRAQREHQSMAIAESAYWSIRLRIQEARKECECGGGTEEPSFYRAVRLENVSFGYEERAILRDVSLEFPKGSFTALVGPSGAGKTTIADIVTGLAEPWEGEVLIDDTPLRRIDMVKWRRMIGYVPQDTVLLHDTIFNNVTLGDPAFSEADAELALRRAGAWEFVSSLSLGMKTVTGERGSRLSGGQRQRITIARALVHRPALLILDEATSALDQASEKEICATLKSLSGDITIIAISHQDSLREAAERVYRLESSRLERVR